MDLVSPTITNLITAFLAEIALEIYQSSHE
jgi:hypothetical protein